MATAHKKTTVAVGLSGGVDSSVAAVLLQEKGYDLIGVSMEIFSGPNGIESSGNQACYGPGETKDIEAAARVCRRLGIPFHTFDLKKEFKRHVLDYFKSEYLSGRTPNPCVMCNQRLKFGFLLEKTMAAGVDFQLFATGHYAKKEKSGGKYLLKKAEDESKDQTYFLYRLTPEQLAHALFPLGTYQKSQVRKIARLWGLETAYRMESQDFIAGNDYAVLFDKEEVMAGEIVDEDGNLLGNHRGVIHYTIGQRHGLGIASDRPLYVSKIDAKNNRIVLSDKKRLFSDGLIAKDLNLMAIETLDRPYDVKVKIRLNQKESSAMLLPHGDDRAKIIFNRPQIAVTPGQSAVFYNEDTVVGGGIIEAAF